MLHRTTTGKRKTCTGSDKLSPVSSKQKNERHGQASNKKSTGEALFLIDSSVKWSYFASLNKPVERKNKQIFVYLPPSRPGPSLVVVDPTLHGGVGLDTPRKVTRCSEQRFVELPHRTQESFCHRGPDKALRTSQASITTPPSEVAEYWVEGAVEIEAAAAVSHTARWLPLSSSTNKTIVGYGRACLLVQRREPSRAHYRVS